MLIAFLFQQKICSIHFLSLFYSSRLFILHLSLLTWITKYKMKLINVIPLIRES